MVTVLRLLLGALAHDEDIFIQLLLFQELRILDMLIHNDSRNTEHAALLMHTSSIISNAFSAILFTHLKAQLPLSAVKDIVIDTSNNTVVMNLQAMTLEANRNTIDTLEYRLSTCHSAYLT